MYKFLLIFSLPFLIASSTAAQTKAITDEGEEVWLNEDGTWSYVNVQSKGYTINPDTVYAEKDKKATFLLKGKKVPYGVYIDPKKWKIEKGESGDHEYFLSNREEGSIYSSIIPERVPIPYNTLKNIAINNAKDVAPDAHIVSETVKVVNGKVLHQLIFKGTLKGIKFTYLGYYYTDDSKTIQLLTFTVDTLFEEYKEEMIKYLNGLVILD